METQFQSTHHQCDDGEMTWEYRHHNTWDSTASPLTLLVHQTSLEQTHTDTLYHPVYGVGYLLTNTIVCAWFTDLLVGLAGFHRTHASSVQSLLVDTSQSVRGLVVVVGGKVERLTI